MMRISDDLCNEWLGLSIGEREFSDEIVQALSQVIDIFLAKKWESDREDAYSHIITKLISEPYLKSFNPEKGKFFSYAYSLINYAWMDYCKDRKKHQVATAVFNSEGHDILDHCIADLKSESSIYNTILLQELENFLGSERYYILSEIAFGKSYAELESELNIKSSTLRKQVQRARDDLKSAGLYGCF